MNYAAKSLDIVKQSSQCIVIGIYDGRRARFDEAAATLDAAMGKRLAQRVKQGHISGKIGKTQMLFDPGKANAQRALIVGLGPRGDLDSHTIRRAAASATRALIAGNVKAADFFLPDNAGKESQIIQKACAVIEGAAAAAYRYGATKSDKPQGIALKKLNVIAAKGKLSAARKGVRKGAALASGLAHTKELSNLPGNICTPSYLARYARSLQKTHGLKTTVLDEAQMKKLKMGSLLSVSRGSREPARLIIMEYRGGPRTDAPIVLVGKGLTFDAGGISIKPAAAMDEMKFDMCGGASVFGTMVAVSELELPLNVIGIVPSSENLPDGAANKPGDIVTAMSGKTIEILNTDAEGRLILCDALTYAKRYKPAAVIDIATLTGACVIALGHHASGLFSNNAKLARQLLAAGEASGDRAWQLPIWDDYTRQLRSNFADLANIGGRGAGAVTAACFLAEFTGDYDWAHLDIAGTAWKSGSDKGATGRPVPLLLEFLLNRCHW